MNMHRTYLSYILILLMLLGPAAVAAQQVFTSRVVDADTRDPLPFVKVFSRTAEGTLTNYEGRFSIRTAPSDTLEISLIGYATQRIIAANLPHTIRMSVRSQQMREVTVTPIQSLLVRASKQLAKEFERHKGQTSTFFLRMRQDFFQDSTTWAGLQRQMIEAFVSGQSAVNLRSPKVITGYRSGYAPAQLSGNIYQFIQTGAMVLGDGLFLARKNVVTPLHPKASASYYKKNYVVREKAIRGEHGEDLRLITFNTYSDVTSPIIVGTLLIDYETLRPLSFDGYIENIKEWVNVDEYKCIEPIRPHFRVQYRHDRGFTEVATLFVRASMSKKDERNTLVNMGQMALPPGVKVADEGLYAAIDAAGFDPQFWAEHETVMRTNDEEFLFRNARNNPTANQDSIAAPDDRGYAEGQQRYQAELQRRNDIALSRIRGAVVVDAQTKKPIPFTDVTVVGRTRTVTNLGGFYSIAYQPTDTLLFHCNGYEPLRLLGSAVRPVVQLTPFRVVAKNPEDIGMEELLNQIGTRLQKQLTAHPADSANYHFRRIRTLLRDTVMTEAFLRAPCAVRLDEPKVLLARNFYVDQPEVQNSLEGVYIKGYDLNSINHEGGNFDVLRDMTPMLSSDQLSKLEIALPRAVQKSWDEMERRKRDFDRPYTPFIGKDKAKQYSKMFEPIGEDHIPFSILSWARALRKPSEITLLEDQSGHRYCRITLKRRWAVVRDAYGNLNYEEQKYPTSVGNLLIDMSTMRMLSFDGDLRGVETNVPTMRDLALHSKYKPYVSIRYDFTYDRGFPEVWHYASNINSTIDGQTEQYSADWFTMFNTRGMDVPLTTDGLEHATLRIDQEERMARQEPQPTTELTPAFILFDLINENNDWKRLRW